MTTKSILKKTAVTVTHEYDSSSENEADHNSEESEDVSEQSGSEEESIADENLNVEDDSDVDEETNGIEEDSAADESMADDESDQDAEKSEDPIDANKGWADSMAQVLKQSKPKKKKSLTLARARKIQDFEKKKAADIGFEIDGEIKKEIKPDPTELDVEEVKPKNKLLSLRVKPSILDREREQTFKRIATKGVVQLFNAVKAQQKDLARKLDDAGKLDHRRDAVLNNIDKRKFLDVLMGGSRAKSELVDVPVKKEEDDDDDLPSSGKSKEWNILRDDYISGSTNTHWDRDDEEDEDGDAAMSNSSDDD